MQDDILHKIKDLVLFLEKKFYDVDRVEINIVVSSGYEDKIELLVLDNEDKIFKRVLEDAFYDVVTDRVIYIYGKFKHGDVYLINFDELKQACISILSRKYDSSEE